MTLAQNFLEEIKAQLQERTFPNFSVINTTFSENYEKVKTDAEKEDLLEALFRVTELFEQLALETNPAADLTEFRKAVSDSHGFRIIRESSGKDGLNDLLKLRPLVAREVRARRIKTTDPLVDLAVKGYNFEATSAPELSPIKTSLRKTIDRLYIDKFPHWSVFATTFSAHFLAAEDNTSRSQLLEIMFAVRGSMLKNVRSTLTDDEFDESEEILEAYYASLLLSASFVGDAFDETLYRTIIATEVEAGRLKANDPKVEAAIEPKVIAEKLLANNKNSSGLTNAGTPQKKKGIFGFMARR